MVGTLTSIYRSEKSLRMQGICARYRGRPERARWGQNRRVSNPAEYFRGGARGIGTCRGKHWAVRCCATAHRSPYRHFCLVQILVTQLASYSPCTLAFTLILYHSSRARKACCSFTRLSPCILLTSSFLLNSNISHSFLSLLRISYIVPCSVSDTSSQMPLHGYILPLSSAQCFTPIRRWFWKSNLCFPR
jgi:hypothetical protein